MAPDSWTTFKKLFWQWTFFHRFIALIYYCFLFVIWNNEMCRDYLLDNYVVDPETTAIQIKRAMARKFGRREGLKNIDPDYIIINFWEEIKIIQAKS